MNNQRLARKDDFTRTPSRQGFTLIELLVVIAIIAILAAILFPVFARARENARKASCMSNLKQIGLGIMQYTQDYDEKLPGRWIGHNGSSGQTWRYLLWPYTKSAQLFVCPSNFNKKLASDRGPGTPADVPVITRSYACNGGRDELPCPAPSTACQNTNNIGGTAPMRMNVGSALTELTDPAQLLLVTESIGGAAEIPMAHTTAGTPASIAASFSFAGHNGRMNVLFADGHVKTLKPTQTGRPVNFWTIEEDGEAPQTLMDRLLAIENNVEYN